MIKFFRKIRQNLLKEGKTTRYFKYALGEIILVVIGIIIALQINNWNNNRISRSQEITYLKSIKENLQSDLGNISFNIQKRQEKIKAAQYIVKQMENTQKQALDNLIAINNNTFSVINVDNFKANNITFTELVSSGNVNIISNPTLKNTLLKLEFEYTLNDQMIAHENFDYEQYISKPFFKTVDFNSMLPKYLNGIKDENLSISRQQYQQLLTNLEFKNGCLLSIVMSKAYFLPGLMKIEKLSKQAIQLINSETKNEYSY